SSVFHPPANSLFRELARSLRKSGIVWQTQPFTNPFCTMRHKLPVILLGLLLTSAAGMHCQRAGETPNPDSVTLLNVSYDPTRELYQEFNRAFAEYWKEETG